MFRGKSLQDAVDQAGNLLASNDLGVDVFFVELEQLIHNLLTVQTLVNERHQHNFVQKLLFWLAWNAVLKS